MQNREILFEIYRDSFGLVDIDETLIRKEFDGVMKLKYKYMPYFLVLAMMDLGMVCYDMEY